MGRRTLKNTLQWELLSSSIPVYRTPITGGWLVAAMSFEQNSMTINTTTPPVITFVPDENHTWNGSSDLGNSNHKHYLFNKELAIKFALSSHAFRHKNHAINSLNKFLTENDTKTPEDLSMLWYARVLDKTHGFQNDDMRTYNERSFLDETKEVKP